MMKLTHSSELLMLLLLLNDDNDDDLSKYAELTVKSFAQLATLDTRDCKIASARTRNP